MTANCKTTHKRAEEQDYLVNCVQKKLMAHSVLATPCELNCPDIASVRCVANAYSVANTPTACLQPYDE
jgi:hypothetical protein